MKIGYLFSKTMNVYGDRGNVEVLKYRLNKRNINVEIIEIDENNFWEIDLHSIDLFFMGGGQDKEQVKIGKFFSDSKVRNIFSELVELDKVFLLICGAYQLFGKYYLGQNGEKIEGLGILPIETYALSDLRVDRCIGNIIIETNLSISPRTIVGFENHSGQTKTLSMDIHKLGKVIHGYGDNFHDKTEGIVYKNVFGTYLHGPILPKNPHFADYLIELALNTKLEKLNDELELSAHEYIVKRFQ